MLNIRSIPSCKVSKHDKWKTSSWENKIKITITKTTFLLTADHINSITFDPDTIYAIISIKLCSSSSTLSCLFIPSCFIYEMYQRYMIIDREAGEIIRFVAPVCLSVCLSVCLFVCLSELSCLNRFKVVSNSKWLLFRQVAPSRLITL